MIVLFVAVCSVFMKFSAISGFRQPARLDRPGYAVTVGMGMGGRAYKQLHRELGLCTDCSEPVYRGYSRCLRHLRSHSKWKDGPLIYQPRNREKKKFYRENGCCPMCSAQLDPDADRDLINCVNCRGGIHKERLIHGNPVV